MNEVERKQKLEQQIEEQYLSIGKFVVNFEHLFSSIKNKIALLCGWSQEVHLLLEPFSVRQSIDSLKDLIKMRAEKYQLNEKDIELYNLLIRDLTTLNEARNRVIHTTWYIGWQNEKSTDISEFVGKKFSSQQNSKFKKLTALEINNLTENCKTLYRVFYTTWSIDILELSENVKFHNLWNRDKEGNWIDLTE